MLDEKLEQYQKQLKRMLADETGRKLIGDSLGLKVNFDEDLKGKPIVAVLVPSYRGLHPKMSESSTRMIRYTQQYCTIYTEPIMASSLISWLRNDLVTALYKSGKKFTHVLWLDDDMEFEQDYVVRMLRHEKDVVGCAYTHRTDPPMPNVHLINIHTGAAKRVLKWKEDGLKSSGDPEYTLSLGTGMLLVKKEVFDRVAKFYLDCEHEKRLWKLTDEQAEPIRDFRHKCFAESKNGYWFQLLPRLKGYGESGEDSSFCMKAAMCGFTVWLDTTIRPGHVGEYTYSYSDFLAYEQQAKKKAEDEGGYAELE